MNFQYKNKSDKAFSLHKAGNFKEAEKLYIELLSEKSDDANVLNLYGLLCLSENRYSKSIELLSKAMLYKPDSYVISNLAKAYYSSGEYDNSVKLYKKAAEYGKSDDLYYSLALAYKKSGDTKSCEKAYKKAVELNPGNLNAYYNLMLLYSSQERSDDAINIGEKCVKINDSADEIFALLSELYEKKGNIELAVKNIEKAAEIKGDNYIYYYNLAVLYSKIKKFEKSAENYRKALLINPKHIESYVNIAAVYKKLKKSEISLQYLRIALGIQPELQVINLSLAQAYKDTFNNTESIKLLNDFLKNNPDSAEAYSLLGINYMDLCEYDEALKYYNLALKYSPDNNTYLHGKAVALKYLGKLEECKNILEKIVNSGNADSQTKITLGMIYLQNKELIKGTELYSERNNDTAFVEVFKDKILKFGDSVDNKRILVYSNCGLGDTIMYSRFLPELKERCKSVILQTDASLYTLMKRNFPGISVIKKGENPSEFDFSLSVMDIQYTLNIDFDDIKQVKRYLYPDKTKVDYFKKKIFSLSSKPKIGICFKGNKNIFKNRSIDFKYFEPIIADKRFDFYSFQVKEATEERSGIISLNKYINDYDDTAALLDNIDIMITIDSSVAHMSGASGIKTFLLLPYTAEWRWFNDTKTSLWYKSVRIFKQKEINSVPEVIERVKNELDKYAKKRNL